MAENFNDDQVSPVALLLWDGSKWARLTTTTLLTVDGSGVTQPISVASLPLPSGAATEATLASLLTELGQKLEAGGAVTISGTVPVSGTFFQATQPVSAASLPLPSGAATESTLSTLNGKVTACNTGAVVVASGTVTSTDGGAGKTLKSVSFSLSATGTAITGVSTKRLKVYAIKMVVSAALIVNWRDGGTTALEGAQSLAINGGYVESVDPPNFLFATTAGNSLDLVITGVGTAAGRISYWDDDTA